MNQSNLNEGLSRGLKFTYIRVPNANVQDVTPSGRAHRGDPIGCIVSKVVTINELDVREVVYQVSVANERDEFSKPMARSIALGRFDVGKVFSAGNVPKGFKHYDVTIMIMKHLMNNVEIPHRARKAAKRWLKVNVQES